MIFKSEKLTLEHSPSSLPRPRYEAAGTCEIVGVRELLGAGDYGRVVLSEVELTYLDENKHEKSRTDILAVKWYTDQREGDQHVERAYLNYCRMRDAGLTVLPIFLVDRTKRAIVMTDLSENGMYVVMSPYNSNRVYFEEGGKKFTVSGIVNLKEVLNFLFHEADVAAQANLRVDYGVPIFRVPRKQQEGEACQLQALLVDVDTVEPPAFPRTTEEQLKLMNKKDMYTALREWVEQFVDEPERAKELALLEQMDPQQK